MRPKRARTRDRPSGGRRIRADGPSRPASGYWRIPRVKYARHSSASVASAGRQPRPFRSIGTPSARRTHRASNPRRSSAWRNPAWRMPPASQKMPAAAPSDRRRSRTSRDRRVPLRVFSWPCFMSALGCRPPIRPEPIRLPRGDVFRASRPAAFHAPAPGSWSRGSSGCRR